MPPFRRSVLCSVTVSIFAAWAASARPLRVVTTVPAVYSWVASIGGADVEVSNIPDNGANPHDYQPRPSDRHRLARADLVVLVGAGFDDWLSRSLPDARPNASPGVFTLFTLVPKADRQPSEDTDSTQPPNPHFWLSPSVAARLLEPLAQAMEAAAPDHRSAFAARAAAYESAVTALDAGLAEVLTGVRGKSVVCYHDAFGYFLHRYGIRVAAVISEGPEREPGLLRVNEAMKTARARQARAVVVEAGDNQALARRFAADLRAPTLELDALETGPLEAGRYEASLRQSARRLAEALR